MHYLDNFITAGPAQSDQCARNLSIAISVCRSLGLPRHPSKCIGPCTCMLVLGIDLNLEQQTARLPADKLAALKGLIYSGLSQRWCTRQQLESLIGHLHRATRVVWPERSFLRRMINILCCFRRRDHLIRLWHELLTICHRVSFDLILNVASHRFKGHLRCCRLLGLRGYFQGQWCLVSVSGSTVDCILRSLPCCGGNFHMGSSVVPETYYVLL